ncbi:TetR/AcrR family transcriptional regulator C-terminal domain-containing protein [Actinomadura barringtoniae]|uniref:TetR/AcrR family transcriptional regulator C-terminal domain-containing protein n=1 Tax=Actinomadura barringtoniae TaxID=1427535 RepID=A0A939PFB4_9ACTN|nr:TetR/AcrR family transcriptional regulator [Actinomadura barringtoniae]MBO2451586.1 TetR/AcrR family transcriptional regulator C-terminal domain-containing protein [Actinomadura barringtoniae]
MAENSVWDRPRAGRRPKLSREAIVETAIRLADAEGLDAVTIRRIASELGVRPMSLYTHVERKEDLFDLMFDELSGEILVEGELAADWREAITSVARREREFLLNHPWVIELVGRRQPKIGPNGLRHGEQSLAALTGLGVDIATAGKIVTAVDHYMTGYVVREQTQTAQEGALDQPYVQELLASGEFPTLKRAIDAGVAPRESFEEGLKWLLDGIEREFGGDPE